MMSWGA
jgi:large subunit ribosomal protein L4